MARFTALRWLLRLRHRTYAASAVAVYTVAVLVVLTIAELAAALWNAPGCGHDLGRLLATALVVALVGPVASTCRVAARLSQRQRHELLSTVRLLGCSSHFVRSLSLIGELATVTVGAALGSGIVVSGALLLRVGTLEGAPPVGAILAVAGVAVIAALNSMGGIKGVLSRPLSVRMRSDAPSMSAWRAVVGVFLFMAAMALLRMIGPGWGMIAVASAVTVAVLTVNMVLGLVGPWIVSVLASRRLARANSAAQLIAMRDIMESPAAAWRQVSTLSLMSFLLVPVGSLLAYLSLIQSSTPDLDSQFVSNFADVRSTVLAAVTVSLVLTITAVGAGQRAAIEERRELHIALNRMGMSARRIAQARRRAVALPLDVAVFGSAVLSVLFFWWLVLAGAASMSLYLPATAVALLGSTLAVRLLLYATIVLIRRQLRPVMVPDEELGAPDRSVALR